jgi:hypothetical protein
MMRALVVLIVLIATGCMNWGTRPEDFPPALGPQGARVAVRVTGESEDRVGELLEVDSDGITIRSSRVIRIAWRRLHAMDVDAAGVDYDIRFGEQLSDEKLARLKLISRFPQGMQRLPITLDSLISDASRETSRFADRRLAVTEGYRRVGADFPGMGEHWVNLPVLMQNRIDPEHPTLLTYATIAGVPTLLGVGFVVVTHGDDTPVDVPGWPSEWHEHSGLLSEESGARVGPARASSPTHVWVMHVWTRLENPNGQLTADNWSLPFRRAGIATPRAIDADAGRAASLAVGGDAFLRDALTDAELRTPANSAAVDSAIDTARSRAATLVRADADVVALRATWTNLSTSLERVLGPGVREILHPVHSHAHDGANR